MSCASKKGTPGSVYSRGSAERPWNAEVNKWKGGDGCHQPLCVKALLCRLTRVFLRNLHCRSILTWLSRSCSSGIWKPERETEWAESWRNVWLPDDSLGVWKELKMNLKKNICAAWSVSVYLIEEKLWFHSHSGHILVKVHWGWVAASLYMTRQSSVNTWIDRNWKFSLNTLEVKLSQTTTVVSSYLTNSSFMKSWSPAGVREGSENQQHTHTSGQKCNVLRAERWQVWRNSGLGFAFGFLLTLSLLHADRWTLKMLCDADVQRLYRISSNCSLSRARRVQSRPCRHVNQCQRSTGRSSSSGPWAGRLCARKLLRMPKVLCLVEGRDQGWCWKCWMSALVTKALKDKSRNLSISRECAEMEKKNKQRGKKKTTFSLIL